MSSNKLFTTIPKPKVPRNVFNLSNQVALSMSFNKCYPARIMEVIPGDLFSVSAEMFTRLMPMLAPVLNDMKVRINAFYVPFRTLNNHFNEFMWNNKDGDYSEVMPYSSIRHLLFVLSGIGLEDYSTFSEWVDAESIAPADVQRYVQNAYRYVLLLRYMGIPYDYSSFVLTDMDPDLIWSTLQEFYNDNLPETSILRVNLAPFFAYEKVWNEYFRDENLVDDIFEVFSANSSFPDWQNWTGKIDIGSDWSSSDMRAFMELMQLRPKAWGHDRFTSALPFAQRGPDVALPIEFSGDYPVKYNGNRNYGYLPSSPAQAGRLRPNNSSQSDRVALEYENGSGSTGDVNGRVVAGAFDQGETAQMSYDPGDTLYADVDDVQISSTIRDFRRALRLQQWYENSARGGYRPNEAALAHFGVSVPDQSLQRAQFLGGMSSPLVISEVPQTSEGTQSSPQGTLAGKATSYGNGHLFKQFFSEHGFIIIMTSCTVRANYFQGLDRMFSRMTRDEYAWPEFANLGEEPIYTKEIYAQEPGVADDTVFGYLPRYADYKSAVNQIKGDFTTNLKFWVQPREFDDIPKLNEKFIYDSAPLTPFAVQDGSDVILSIMNIGVKASRLLPFYGVPTI